jgi:hypothetical protein
MRLFKMTFQIPTLTLHPNKLKSNEALQCMLRAQALEEAIGGLDPFDSKHSGGSAQQCMLGVQTLEESLTGFQRKLEAVGFEQTQLCSTVLDNVLEQFLGLVSFVSESDSDLLDRAQHGQRTTPDTLRHSMAEIFQRIQQVAASFDDAIDKFTKGFAIVKLFDAEVAHFSVSTVSRIRDDVEEVIEQYKDDIRNSTSDIQAADRRLRETRNQIAQLGRSINEARQREDRHEVARNVSIGVSVLNYKRRINLMSQTSVVGGIGFLGTIGLLIVCPPAGAGAALALGAGSLTSAGVTTAAGIIAK